MRKSETIKIYLDQIRKTPQLSEEDEKKFFGRIGKKGKRAKQARLKIIEANLPLVVGLAKKYYYPGMNIEFLNFIEEGNIGLVKAVERFDVTKGFKFSTYASWWIEKHFQSAILKSKSIIQIPEKTWRSLKKYEQTTTQLLHETGQAPDIKEISQKIDLTIAELRNTLHSTIKAKNIRSLDYFIDKDKTRTLGDLVSSEEFYKDDMEDKMSEEQQLNDLLNILTDEEKEVLKLRFGLADGRNYTYKEIGDKLKISMAKAKVVQDTAIKKLRRARTEE